jgi:hypothetical protein
VVDAEGCCIAFRNQHYMASNDNLASCAAIDNWCTNGIKPRTTYYAGGEKRELAAQPRQRKLSRPKQVKRPDRIQQHAPYLTPGNTAHQEGHTEQLLPRNSIDSRRCG